MTYQSQMSLPPQKSYLEFRARVTKQGERFFIQVPKAYSKDITEKGFYSGPGKGKKKVVIDVKIETT
jgi:hypothetical protein